ncbi:hypothetical protein JCM6882_005345 [Rhodosporidiobolus microsporus]
MPSWAQRRNELGELLKNQPAKGTGSQEEQLHLALLAEENGRDRRSELGGPQKRLRSAAPSPDDFPSLSILSSTGSFGRVELVRPSASLSASFGSGGKVYVMKTVDRRWAFRMREQQSLRHELAVLRLPRRSSTGAARIPQLVASFLSTSSFHVVLEHASGGDVWSVLECKNAEVEQGAEVGLPEDWVRPWMAELVDSLEWLHGQGWVHRDVKPQNMLLRADGHLLLTDFGSAAPVKRGTASIARRYCRALTGTPDYIAPEVLLHAEKVYEENEEDEDEFGDGGGSSTNLDELAYGAEIDVWACGVVLYELLTGRAPFFAEEISETYERIIHWQDNLAFSDSSSLSKSARQGIQRLLVAAENRPTFAQIKALPFFAGVDWLRLRRVSPPYVPPAFHPPPSSPSFTRSAQSFASDLDCSSFFSSPGLSILRPSPRTADSARSEEREYWEAREFGGLTTLPDKDEFDRPPTYPVAAVPSRTEPATRSTGATSPFETPARPFFRPLRSAAAVSSTPAPAGSTPASSGRARRMISEMEAWREMQEHAWVVGMSARKQRRESGAGVQASPRPQVQRSPLKPTTATAPRGGWEVGGTAGGKEEETGLGGLEQRQREMVLRLEEMDKKYEKLFALAAKEGGARG